MSASADYRNPHGVQVNDVWKVNDSGNTFTVHAIGNQYADVVNDKGTVRRILLCNLRESKAKTGYTLLSRWPVEPGDAP